jgi:hypothetical protein
MSRPGEVDVAASEFRRLYLRLAADDPSAARAVLVLLRRIIALPRSFDVVKLPP